MVDIRWRLGFGKNRFSLYKISMESPIPIKKKRRYKVGTPTLTLSNILGICSLLGILFYGFTLVRDVADMKGEINNLKTIIENDRKAELQHLFEEINGK